MQSKSVHIKPQMYLILANKSQFCINRSIQLFIQHCSINTHHQCCIQHTSKLYLPNHSVSSFLKSFQEQGYSFTLSDECMTQISFRVYVLCTKQRDIPLVYVSPENITTSDLFISIFKEKTFFKLW